MVLCDSIECVYVIVLDSVDALPRGSSSEQPEYLQYAQASDPLVASAFSYYMQLEMLSQVV